MRWPRRWRRSRSRRPQFRWSPTCWPSPISDPAEIRQCLVQQVTGTVRWRECVRAWPRTASPTSTRSARARCWPGLAKRIVPTLERRFRRHAAGHRSRAIRALTIIEDAHVRSERQNCAGHRRDRRHRRRPSRAPCTSRGRLSPSPAARRTSWRSSQPSSARAFTCAPAISPTRRRWPS